MAENSETPTIHDSTETAHRVFEVCNYHYKVGRVENASRVYRLLFRSTEPDFDPDAGDQVFYTHMEAIADQGFVWFLETRIHMIVQIPEAEQEDYIDALQELGGVLYGEAFQNSRFALRVLRNIIVSEEPETALRALGDTAAHMQRKGASIFNSILDLEPVERGIAVLAMLPTLKPNVIEATPHGMKDQYAEQTKNSPYNRIRTIFNTNGLVVATARVTGAWKRVTGSLQGLGRKGRNKTPGSGNVLTPPTGSYPVQTEQAHPPLPEGEQWLPQTVIFSGTELSPGQRMQIMLPGPEGTRVFMIMDAARYNDTPPQDAGAIMITEQGDIITIKADGASGGDSAELARFIVQNLINRFQESQKIDNATIERYLREIEDQIYELRELSDELGDGFSTLQLLVVNPVTRAGRYFTVAGGFVRGQTRRIDEGPLMIQTNTGTETIYQARPEDGQTFMGLQTLHPNPADMIIRSQYLNLNGTTTIADSTDGRGPQELLQVVQLAAAGALSQAPIGKAKDDQTVTGIIFP